MDESKGISKEWLMGYGTALYAVAHTIDRICEVKTGVGGPLSTTDEERK